jgi:glyoxylase-like metal-dependent hydrolase (beta-lactamase superfamily II)
MRRMMFIFVLSTLSVASAYAQDAKTVLDAAIKNLGDLKSVQYSGSGAQFNVGQSLSADAAWPKTDLKSFTRTVDYQNRASRVEAVGPNGPMATQFVAVDKAWGQNGANITPAAPVVAADRQLQIWLTPHGFLKAALASNAKASKRGQATIVTFTTPSKHRVVGTISPDNLVQKVESWFDNPVLGDMLIETTYSDYRDMGGFKFPTKVLQKQGGYPAFDLTVAEAKSNVSLDAAVPDVVAKATPPAVNVTTEKLADRVWYLAGGSHHSVLLEFADHVAIIEGPLNEERSTAVIAAVKKISAKPIRYLINTHHHFDHSGGLRTYVAEGATIVTHQSNKAFYETTFKSPHAIAPDRQQREKKKARILPIGAKHVMSDSDLTAELYQIEGSPHNTGILMAWLPKEKLLVEVDVYTPLAPNAPPPATPPPAMVNLYENITRLKLDVQRIVPLHGRIVELAELKKTIGK